MLDQPFASSEIGESMDADLLPELSGETWVDSALIEEFTADLLPAGSNVDLITASRQDTTLATVWGGFSQNPLRHGLSVRDFLRKWEICLLTQMAGYGGDERRQRRAHNLWFPGVNGKR